MNAESSRSHLICSLIVRLKNKRTGKESLGKLTLVDLAGSEVSIFYVMCFDIGSSYCIFMFTSVLISRGPQEKCLKRRKVLTNHYLR